jgi:hypothetical protein
VMAILAMTYGIASKHGIWYPINLLAAGFFPARNTTAQIAAFYGDSFGLVCFTAFLESSIQSLISALTGSGLFFRSWDSAWLLASWFPGKRVYTPGSTFHLLFALGSRPPEP